MVLLIIIPFLNGYFIGNIPYFQTNPLGFGLGQNWAPQNRWTQYEYEQKWPESRKDRPVRGKLTSGASVPSYPWFQEFWSESSSDEEDSVKKSGIFETIFG